MDDVGGNEKNLALKHRFLDMIGIQQYIHVWGVSERRG
jgi:hypothetical protein